MDQKEKVLQTASIIKRQLTKLLRAFVYVGKWLKIVQIILRFPKMLDEYLQYIALSAHLMYAVLLQFKIRVMDINENGKLKDIKSKGAVTERDPALALIAERCA